MAWTSTMLPRGDESSPWIDPPLRTARWLEKSIILDALGSDEFPIGKSPLIVGCAGEGAKRKLVSHDDDRHAMLVVGSRGGKSVSFIIPNLLSYKGSIIVTDPKGELAATTALYRRDVLKQKVVVLDPFGVLLLHGRGDLPFGRYNPMEWIDRYDRELIDEAALLADAIVVKEPKDVHFTESAKTYLKAILLYLIANSGGGSIDLLALRKMAMCGEDGRGIEALLTTLASSKLLDGAIARSAAMIANMGDRELGAVISTVGRNTDFLDSPAMISNLSGSSSFDPRLIKDQPTTVYLVLPEWRLSSHSRWLRIVISSLLSHLQRAPTRPDKPSTLLLIDEFASLGHMESIERAASYIAGFGVRLVLVVQDLNQLKATYGDDRWQTFVANSGLIVAFANADMMTAEYLSKRCVETEVLKLKRTLNSSSSANRTTNGLIRRIEGLFTGHGLGAIGDLSNQAGTSRATSVNPEMTAGPLITPDEVMVHFARETGAAMVLINGARPMRVTRIRYWDDPLFAKLAAPSPFHRSPDVAGSFA